jgi:3'-phosphoadenosine 5'-phosphosulfate sulfotransferase (PAPS reductase)/FAD synthetase
MSGRESLLDVALPLARRTLDIAIAEWKPIRVFALFSGGGDSMVAAHVVSRDARFSGCVFIDTGTSLPGVIEHAQEVCRDYGWPLHIIQSPQTYEDMIREYGLPGPGQHPTAYVRLKEKALDAFVRANCPRCKAGERHSKHGQILWVSGARQDESVRRMGNATDFVVRDGSQVWVNPILDWSESDCVRYRALYGLEKSDVAALVHRSGECNCGTYAQPGEREMLCALFPEFAEKVAGWESLAVEHGHGHAAVWGKRPTKHSGQLTLTPRHQIACSDCAGRVSSPPSEPAEVAA